MNLIIKQNKCKYTNSGTLNTIVDGDNEFGISDRELTNFLVSVIDQREDLYEKAKEHSFSNLIVEEEELRNYSDIEIEDTDEYIQLLEEKENLEFLLALKEGRLVPEAPPEEEVFIPTTKDIEDSIKKS